MEPKVSVITCCYNQQDTIEQAIRSVREQESDFLIEHIISDDGSQDSTLRRVVDAVSTPFGSDIHSMMFFHPHVGLMRNYEYALDWCTGEYIAFCDGDDYWRHPSKLQMQVDYMDEHPECGLCTTRVTKRTLGWFSLEPISTEDINKNLSYDSLLKGTIPIHAQSYLIRRSVFDKYVRFNKFVQLGFKVWDLPIILELIQHSKFHCLDIVSAVFVKNPESTTNTESRKKRFKYLMNNYKIKSYYICKYGCKVSTIFYLIYKFIRDIYSIIFKRWSK